MKPIVLTANHGQFSLERLMAKCPDRELHTVFRKVLMRDPDMHEPAQSVAQKWIGKSEIPCAYPQLLMVYPYLSQELQRAVLEGKNFKEWLGRFGKNPVRDAAAHVLEFRARELQIGISRYPQQDYSFSIAMTLEMGHILTQLYEIQNALVAFARKSLCTLYEQEKKYNPEVHEALISIINNGSTALLARVAKRKSPVEAPYEEEHAPITHIPTSSIEAIDRILLDPPYTSPYHLARRIFELRIKGILINHDGAPDTELAPRIIRAIEQLAQKEGKVFLERAYVLAGEYAPEQAGELARKLCECLSKDKSALLDVLAIADAHGLYDVLLASLNSIVELDVNHGSNYLGSYETVRKYGFVSEELLLLGALEQVELVLRGNY